MILKGNQRAGGADLATHLMNAFDNERIEVAQIRGTVADDLHGAFGEYEALAAGTRCKEPLYSLSINPPEPISREQYFTAIDRIEQRLGLARQPRAVVFHVKHGREHCHVVWSRIDTARMRAVQISHDRMKLRSLAKELAMEFGLPLPDGIAQDRGAERRRKKDMTRSEKVQAEATGIAPGQRRAEITEAFRRSDNAEAFRTALKEQGYILARGDRRGFVVVDRFGKVHSLARQIDGVKTRELNEKLAPLTPDQLPPAAEIAEAMRQDSERKAALAAANARIGERASKLSAELDAKQAERRRKLDRRRQELDTLQAGERMSLHAAHASEAKSPFARAAGAIFGLFDRVPGLRSVIAPLRRNPKINPAERHRIEREALARRHQRERFMLERRYTVLEWVEARERRSLEAAIRREIAAAENLRAEAGGIREEIALNKADITMPAADARGIGAGQARDGRDAWKRRKKELRGQNAADRKPRRGFGLGDDR